MTRLAMEAMSALCVMTAVVVRINKDLGTTTAVITHNADIASIANRVIHLSNGQISGIETNTEKKEPRDLHW